MKRGTETTPNKSHSLISRLRASLGHRLTNAADGLVSHEVELAHLQADLRHARDELAEWKARYAAAIQASGQILYDWEVHSGQVVWDGTLEETLQYSQREIGANLDWWLELVHPNDRDAFSAEITHVTAKKLPFSLEYRVRRKDGVYLTMADRGCFVPGARGAGAHMIGLVTDITARQRTDEENRRLNEELESRVQERTSQLEAANKELEAFAYSISHDLRAPLRAIDGFSRILCDDYALQLPADAVHYLQLVRDSAQRMGRLIDDVLTLARLGRQALNKHMIHPAEIVRQVLGELRHEQENRCVAVAIDELPPCYADPVLLKQVFANLLMNALKFTRHRDVARVTIGAEARDEGCVYFVKDNGVGFDMQYVHKLFGVFQRLHRVEDYEGTGVGLAIVQRIIHRHKGRVWAEATLDHGATFYFTLS